MPLNKSGLEAEIANAYGPNGIAPITANSTAIAISNYWMTGQSNLGGIPIAAAAIPLIMAGLTSVFSSFAPSKELAADQIATVIDGAFYTLIIVGGAHGIGGIVSAVKPVLVSGLSDAFALPATTIQFAEKFAKAIDDYTKTGQVYGTGIPPAFAPPLGPLT